MYRSERHTRYTGDFVNRMFNLKFNHVFVGLMVVSFLAAFVIPQKYSDRVRNVQGLFAPVARPVGAIGAWFRGRVSSEKVEDNRPDRDIRRENDELKVAVANLEAQLETIRRSDASLNVGSLKPLCTRVAVVGPDPGERDSLSLGVVPGVSLRDRMPVLYTGGLVGRIDRAGPLGAQVRLITDPASKITAYFGRWVRKSETETEFQRTATDIPLVEGAGKGMLVVRNLNLKDIRAVGLAEGDWAVLDDNDWPQVVAGQRLGRIISIRTRTDAPLKAEIRLQPHQNLSMLREVMVLTKQ